MNAKHVLMFMLVFALLEIHATSGHKNRNRNRHSHRGPPRYYPAVRSMLRCDRGS
ncbi:hypothetical protein DPMN_118434 [Dreissena polymorpha]|uniref:Uncharacterized protein n=1 Tax=Dreissena polymorpha TaxID=45954 RepID=A0A9D4GGS2_DREPO|nr:hypothetical protein DPMN_118434 [Dreissena polymorpha]